MSYSPIHKASLVDSSTHSPALLELVDLKLSRPIIEHLIDSVVETVDFALNRPSPSHSTRGRSLSRYSEGSAFSVMVNNVLTRAEVEVPVVLASLVYLHRAKPHLHIALEEWANERVFLGALIVASKYLNDSSLKNVHWAVCTGVFGKRDIGRIEREFLDVLDFDLSISENDIMGHHDAVISLVHPQRAHSHYIPAVPELDYSSTSPASTSASLSPRTPSPFVESVAAPHHKSGQAVHHQAQFKAVAPTQAHVSQPHREKKPHSSSTFRILRSLQLPRAFGHSSSSTSVPRSESQVPSHNVTQQGRCQLLPPFAAQAPSQVYA